MYYSKSCGVILSIRVFYYSSMCKKLTETTSKMVNLISCTDRDAAVLAAELIKSGKVIAVPTDTVYGLACDGNNPEATQKLYDIKARNVLKPVAICVNAVEDVQTWGKVRNISNVLLQQLLPGQVTLVFEKSKQLNNPFLNPETSKIGIRIPDYQFINQITSYLCTPMALTSANISNTPSTLATEEFSLLFNKLDAIFDGGTLHEGSDRNRAGSTVVDLSVEGHYSIIREGVAYRSTVKLLEDFGLINLR